MHITGVLIAWSMSSTAHGLWVSLRAGESIEQEAVAIHLRTVSVGTTSFYSSHGSASGLVLRLRPGSVLPSKPALFAIRFHIWTTTTLV